ncbi:MULTISPECIES: carbohydrate kinase family protein [unclassified Polaribacter]|uniref:carbohydrate kinase family protein n=1 Tax=unclassified Polaribacter TaxID=196858 RepID=UPI0011BD8EFC|nr:MULTISPECIES: carbohydrate kinase [unclassified Polaribacter]TXD54438.1 carbohydrate kinase [Polaribacter sp. IC063]TXD60351.1 carbohydrate kinase [Polaribacter sp. IC066]
MNKIVCFGEVLWDVFPTHKKIGGAPLNVATRLQSFSNEVAMISAVGDDDLGKLILNYLQEHQINTEHVQVLNDFKTGEVTVTLNNKGAATYKIEHPKAWDKIAFTEKASNLVKQADAFVFGSLITRDKVSKNTLYQLLEFAGYKVFDINLRPPFYDKDVLIELMQKADFIKLNDDELYEVSAFMGSKFNNLEQNLQFISKETNTKHICVTKGEHGAVLLFDAKLYYNSGYKIKVADTVGSGDSFLGSLISKLTNEEKPQRAIDFACAVGALVAQSAGANPKISNREIANFICGK